MADEKKLRGKRKKQQKRQEQLLEERDRLVALEAELTGKIGKSRKKAEQADTDELREKAADHADALAGERKRVRAEIEENAADRGEVRAGLRRLARKIKKATQKRLARERYWASEHFRFDEFDCNNGVPVPKAAYPALRELCEDYLEPQRRQFGAVHINSGYRTAAYNASIGGASDSVHIYDRHPDAVAADQMYASGSPGEVANWADQHTHPDGMGRYSSFIHQDNRNRIGWPDARWTG